jgi:hypothetical protein
MSDELTPAQRFAAMIAEVHEGAGELGAWNHRVDWDHGAREMADLYAPLSSQNRLYVEWVYGRLSNLFNAVMVAAIPSRRDTPQESAIEMLLGRTIADLQAIGFLTNKGYYPQAYAAARMTYELCDLCDLFWLDANAGAEWFETSEAHREFSRRRVRERLRALDAEPADENDIYGVLCERSHPRWEGLRHTLIEPHRATTEPLSDVDAIAFHWDAGCWMIATLWRMALRLRYVEAGMPSDPDVRHMLTNLNATMYVTLGFQRRRIEEVTLPDQRVRFSNWHDRLACLVDVDGVAIARRVETVSPR